MSEATRLAIASGPLDRARLDTVVLACQRRGEPILDQFTDAERQHIARILATLPPEATWIDVIRLMAGI